MAPRLVAVAFLAAAVVLFVYTSRSGRRSDRSRGLLPRCGSKGPGCATGFEDASLKAFYRIVALDCDRVCRCVGSRSSRMAMRG